MSARDDIFEQLSAYLDGELEAEQARRVEQAAGQDAAVADELRRLRAAQECLTALPRVRVPDGFAQGVLAEARRRGIVPGAPGRRVWLPRIAAAAAVLLALGLAALVCTRIGATVPSPSSVVTAPPGSAPDEQGTLVARATNLEVLLRSDTDLATAEREVRRALLDNAIDPDNVTHAPSDEPDPAARQYLAFVSPEALPKLRADLDRANRIANGDLVAGEAELTVHVGKGYEIRVRTEGAEPSGRTGPPQVQFITLQAEPDPRPPHTQAATTAAAASSGLAAQRQSLMDFVRSLQKGRPDAGDLRPVVITLRVQRVGGEPGTAPSDLLQHDPTSPPPPTDRPMARPETLRVLTLEPYHGGSHRAFIEGWSAAGRHRWTVLRLPAHHWKWRMRHAAVTFADQLARRTARGEAWDVLLASDMLDLACFRGLAPPDVAELPTVAYFHENQITYPVQHDEPRDVHFGLTNLTTCLAADAVWFNAAFHRDGFLGAAEELLAKMPDDALRGATDRIRDRAAVQPQGVANFPPRGPRPPGPLRVCWAARWEHDKNPADLLEALELLAADGAAFRLSVIGPQFRDAPGAFETIRRRFADRIDRWGFQATREDYRRALLDADVFVSTAGHEFFGVSAVEAAAAGAFPLLPRRLAYPEVFGAERPGRAQFFYDGTPADLARCLAACAERLEAGDLWTGDADAGRQAAQPFLWENLAPRLDDAVEHVARAAPGR